MFKIHTAKLLGCILTTTIVLPAYADWTPWQTIQGDATQGLDVSTNTGSFDYGNDARKVSIRYRNRYADTFKGVVVLEVHDAYGEVKLVNDSINLKSGAEDSGSAMYEIGSIVKPTTVRQQNALSTELPVRVEIAGSRGTIVPPPREMNFPGKWMEWQFLSHEETHLTMRRSVNGSEGKFDFEFKNTYDRAKKIHYHYLVPGGASVSDFLIIPPRSGSSITGIPSSSITIDSAQ
jgi:hypothetical protein